MNALRTVAIVILAWCLLLCNGCTSPHKQVIIASDVLHMSNIVVAQAIKDGLISDEDLVRYDTAKDAMGDILAIANTKIAGGEAPGEEAERLKSMINTILEIRLQIELEKR